MSNQAKYGGEPMETFSDEVIYHNAKYCSNSTALSFVFLAKDQKPGRCVACCAVHYCGNGKPKWLREPLFQKAATLRIKQENSF